MFLPIPLSWRDHLLLPVIQYFFSASMLKMTNELLKSYNFPLGIAFLFYFFGVFRISFGFVAVYFLNNDKRCVNMLVLCRVFRELYLMCSFIFMFCKPYTHIKYTITILPNTVNIIYTAQYLLEIEFGTISHALRQRRAAVHNNILYCLYTTQQI